MIKSGDISKVRASFIQDPMISYAFKDTPKDQLTYVEAKVNSPEFHHCMLSFLSTDFEK